MGELTRREKDIRIKKELTLCNTRNNKELRKKYLDVAPPCIGK